jgi:hypothetical protein
MHRPHSLGGGMLSSKKLSTGTSITENSVTKNHVLFTSRQTESSLMQVPLDVKWHQYHREFSNSKPRDIY